MTTSTERRILIVIIPLLAFFVTHLGCPLPLFRLIHMNFYYYNLVFSTAVITSIFLYLRYLVRFSNHRFPWQERFYARTVVQLILGLVVPVMVIVPTTFLYSMIIDRPFANIFRVHIELPVLVLVLFVINVFYEFMNLFGRLARGESKETPSDLMLKKGRESFLVSCEEIACFFIRYGNVYAATFSEELYTVDYNLNTLELGLPSNFFRLNRQFISNYRAIDSFEHEVHQKLRVHLKVDLPSVVISKKRSRSFKDWMGRFAQPIQVISD